MLAALAVCGCADRPESFHAHDPCSGLAVTSQDATPAEHDGIAAALALWRDRGVAVIDAAHDAVAAASPAAIVEIRFDDAAAAFHGVYDPTADRVLINRDLTDAATLGIVIAHELGHAFGLVHVSPAVRPSLMNPGNLITPPTDEDQRALEALWGSCR